MGQGWPLLQVTDPIRGALGEGRQNVISRGPWRCNHRLQHLKNSHGFHFYWISSFNEWRSTHFRYLFCLTIRCICFGGYCSMYIANHCMLSFAWHTRDKHAPMYCLNSYIFRRHNHTIFTRKLIPGCHLCNVLGENIFPISRSTWQWRFSLMFSTNTEKRFECAQWIKTPQLILAFIFANLSYAVKLRAWMGKWPTLQVKKTFSSNSIDKKNYMNNHLMKSPHISLDITSSYIYVATI